MGQENEKSHPEGWLMYALSPGGSRELTSLPGCREATDWQRVSVGQGLIQVQALWSLLFSVTIAACMLSVRRSDIFLRHVFVAPCLSLNEMPGTPLPRRLSLDLDRLFLMVPTPRDMSEFLPLRPDNIVMPGGGILAFGTGAPLFSGGLPTPWAPD